MHYSVHERYSPIHPKAEVARPLVAQTPMQHVPVENEEDKQQAGECDQAFADLAPKPTLWLLPSAYRVEKGNNRTDHSQPAHQLNDAKQKIESGAQDIDVLFRHSKKYEECCQKNDVDQAHQPGE